MLKNKKLLSVLVIAVMVVSMFGSAFAIGGGNLDQEANGTESMDRFEALPFKPLTGVAGVGKAAPTDIFLVYQGWKDLTVGSTVYFENKGEIFTAIYGVQAFGSIADAYALASNNSVIKIGPGLYEEKLEVEKHGVKFYGNFAGVNPNGTPAADTPYDIPLVAERTDDTLETKVNNCDWSTKGNVNGITFAGFKFLDQHQLAPSGSGSITVTGTYIFNNIFEGANKSYSIHCDRGTNFTIVITNNRIVDSNKIFFIGGGGMYDVQVDNNYFVNCKNTPMWLTSCGNNSGIESLISFSGNVLNGCTHSVDLKYTNGTFGENLDYKRIQNNLFYNCGSSSKSSLLFQYWPDHDNNGTISPCTSTACKTLITGNTFYNIPAGVAPINFIGADSRLGKNINYKVTVNRNRFVYPSAAGGKAITSTLVGTIDATNNYYGHCANGIGNEVALDSIDDLFDISSTVVAFLSMPYYADYGLSQYGTKIELGLGADADVIAGGFVPSESKVDNENFLITLKAKTGLETVNLTNVIGGAGVDVKVYKDYSMTVPLENNELYIEDILTNVYVVATDLVTKLSTKYDVVVTSNTDKAKTSIRYVLDASTEDKNAYPNVTITDSVVDIALESKYVYFPFELQVSPSASYELYTDAECKTPYADSTYYMEPDKTTTIYAKVTSGNGKHTQVHTLNFTRTGTNDDDAKIFTVLTPEANTNIFQGRKTIAYRPGIMIDDATFTFSVSPNATYTIYGKYDAATGTLSEELSNQAEPKKIIIGDDITEYYVKVDSNFGYSQIYTIYVYNDIKSTDNVIRGVTGIPDAVITEDEIFIKASETLAVVNAHFETNVFAKVVVYADEHKTFALEPSITTITVNKREVEVRTFQFGVPNNKVFYYVEVTSETGDVRQYKVTLTKDVARVPIAFTDISGHWAENYINIASSQGLVSGRPNGDGTFSFDPDAPATRQEVAVFVCTMLGMDSYAFRGVPLASKLKDTDDMPEWSYNYIKAVYAVGAMVGNPDGYFYPTNNITREEFFQTISSILKLDVNAAADYDLTQFGDYQDVSGWAVPAVKAILKAGIAVGDNGNIKPRANITRAEIATIMTNLSKLG